MLKLDVYNIKQLSDTLTILRQMEKINLNTNMAVDQIESKIAENRKSVNSQTPKKVVNKHRLKCPECGQPMLLLRVNDKPETMVGGDYLFSSLCLNCHYDRFYDKSNMSLLLNVPLDR